MSPTTLAKKLHFKAPPRRKPAAKSVELETTPVDVADIARSAPQEYNKAGKMLIAGLSLAGTAMSAQAAEAAEAVVEQPLQLTEEVITPSDSKHADYSGLIADLENQESQAEAGEVKKDPLADRLSDRADRLKDRVDRVKDAVVPDGWNERHDRELRDGWHLSFEPLDINLRPKWKDGGPALRMKGDFLETAIQKQEDIGNGWTTTKGLRGELEGEVNTYEKPELDIRVQAFKRWEGPLNDDYDARFDVGVGVRNRFMGEHEHEEGLQVGVSARQEIEGGGFEFRGHDYRWYMEGRQHVYRNMTTNQTEANYKFMIGPKRDFDVSLFGREGRVTLTVGPEIKGSTLEGKDPFEVGIKAKIKTRF